MLKGIPKILSPELLKVLCEMGHGDVICIADANFPAASTARNTVLLRADGHSVPELLDAILQVFPLDTYVEKPVTLMAITPHDQGKVETPIWDEFTAIVGKYDDRGADAVGFCERFDFYDTASRSFCILASGEQALYANILLQKGVITD